MYRPITIVQASVNCRVTKLGAACLFELCNELLPRRRHCLDAEQMLLRRRWWQVRPRQHRCCELAHAEVVLVTSKQCTAQRLRQRPKKEPPKGRVVLAPLSFCARNAACTVVSNTIAEDLSARASAQERRNMKRKGCLQRPSCTCDASAMAKLRARVVNCLLVAELPSIWGRATVVEAMGRTDEPL